MIHKCIIICFGFAVNIDYEQIGFMKLILVKNKYNIKLFML